jgi:hypothetical protein
MAWLAEMLQCNNFWQMPDAGYCLDIRHKGTSVEFSINQSEISGGFHFNWSMPEKGEDDGRMSCGEGQLLANPS